MDQPGVNGDWSMKDLVAHLTGWNRRLVAHMQTAERGEPDPPPPWLALPESDDEINAWIYENYQNRSVSEVTDVSQQVFQQLITLLEDLPGDVRIEVIEGAFYLVGVGTERFPAGEFFDHFRHDHESDVRAWPVREMSKWDWPDSSRSVFTQPQ